MMWPRVSKVAIALAIVAGLVLLRFVPLARWLSPGVNWIAHAGVLGMLGFALLYVVATVLLLPASVLTIAAGFAYGPYLGCLLVSPVSMVAASVAFAIARRFGYQRIEKLMQKDARMRSLQNSASERGFTIVLLLRLSPLVPFNFLNYALGLTEIRFKDFFLASFLGMLPGTIMYLYLGSLITKGSQLASSRQSAGATEQIMYWGGLAATLLVSLMIAKLVRSTAIPTLEEPGGDAPSVE